VTAAVFVAFPAPAERGVTKAATDARAIVAITAHMINRLILSMDIQHLLR